MAKQDVLDAINATIVENNQKGITAQSLNNVLTLMTENAGEGGSGEEALRILVPDIMSLAILFNRPTEFTHAFVEEVITSVESGNPESAALLQTTYNKMFTHNAKVYRTLLKKASNKEGTMVLLDCSESLVAFYKVIIPTEDSDSSLLSVNVSASEPATVNVIGIDYDGDLDQEIRISTLVTTDPNASILSNTTSFTLNSSGEITFTYSHTSPYVPANDSYTLSSEQLAVNAAIYSEALNSIMVTGTSSWQNIGPIKLVESDTPNPPLNANVISYNWSERSITYLQDLTLKKAVLASDGNVTVTNLKTI